MNSSLESVNCDFCGSSNHIVVARQTDKIHKSSSDYFTIVECSNCGLNYTNPRPTRESIGRYYPKKYSYHLSNGVFKKIIKLICGWLAQSPFYIYIELLGFKQRQLLNFILPKIADPIVEYYKNGGSGVFLDIGCGSGDSANFWGQRGSLLAYRNFCKVAGVEISNSARHYLQKAGVEVWEDIQLIPKNIKFGAIRMNWSLEHVHQPSAYFQFIKDHLDLRGRAVICVPNYQGLIYRLAKDCVELPIHLYHFKPEDMKKYGSKYGLQLVTLRTFSYPAMFSVASQYGLLPNQLFSTITLSEAKKYQAFFNELDKADLGNDLIAIFENGEINCGE
jgi:SAM-dependent methyltransferase